MAGYVVKEMLTNGAAVSCLASSTTAVTPLIRISHEDSQNLLLRATVSAITVTNGITLVLQDSPDGIAWSTVKSTSISTTTNYEQEINLMNATDTAIWPLARVVVVTGVGDTATISSVLMTRRL